MKYGLKENTIKVILDVFKRCPQVKCAILYGSRAKGNFRYNSDIDLTLKGENLDLTTLLKLENDIDDLLLPYKMDLSIFHRIEDQGLIDHIARVGIIFYEKENS